MTDDDQADQIHTADTRVACPGCIEAVQSMLDLDLGDGEEEFDQGFGDLIDDLHDALAALNRAARERYTNRHDEIANSFEAATKLVLIKNGVECVIRRAREIGGHATC